MRSLKEGLESIKDDNEKLLRARADWKEINEILLKSITKKKTPRQVGQTSIHQGQGPFKEESHKIKVHEITKESSESIESLEKRKESHNF